MLFILFSIFVYVYTGFVWFFFEDCIISWYEFFKFYWLKFYESDYYIELRNFIVFLILLVLFQGWCDVNCREPFSI